MTYPQHSFGYSRNFLALSTCLDPGLSRHSTYIFQLSRSFPQSDVSRTIPATRLEDEIKCAPCSFPSSATQDGSWKLWYDHTCQVESQTIEPLKKSNLFSIINGPLVVMEKAGFVPPSKGLLKPRECQLHKFEVTLARQGLSDMAALLDLKQHARPCQHPK